MEEGVGSGDFIAVEVLGFRVGWLLFDFVVNLV